MSSSSLLASLSLLSVLGVGVSAASFNAANIDHEDPEGLPPAWRQLKHSDGLHVMADPASGGGAADNGWNYRRYDAANGPYAWKTAASGSTICGGQRQSPIDIVTSTRMSISSATPVKYDAALPAISTDFKTHKNVSIVNNGHTVQLTFDSNAATYSSFTAGALGTDVYKLAQFHFHQMSEHTIDGKYNPAELHLVGMNTNPAHATDSLELSVIGIMLQEADPASNPQDNSVIAAIIEVIESAGLKTPGVSSYVTKAFDMKALIIPLQTSPHYWTYLGSLTMPNCRESVTWHVVQTPLLLPGKQLDKLREVLGNNDETGQFNYRNTQPLNGRVVRTNKPADTTPAPAAVKTGAAASVYAFNRLTMAVGVAAGVIIHALTA